MKSDLLPTLKRPHHRRHDEIRREGDRRRVVGRAQIGAVGGEDMIDGRSLDDFQGVGRTLDGHLHRTSSEWGCKANPNARKP